MPDATCIVCQGPIPADWAALWNPTTGEAVHLGCEADLKPAEGDE